MGTTVISRGVDREHGNTVVMGMINFIFQYSLLLCAFRKVIIPQLVYHFTT